MRVIAISDIHGCAITFRKLVEEKVQLQSDDLLYILGDYIDRGPDSKGVVDYILSLRQQGFQVRTLMGNHERMLLDGIEDDRSFQDWANAGGAQTMKSYDTTHIEAIMDLHGDFYRQLSLFETHDRYIFVHAGLNTQLVNPFTDETSLLWARNWYRKIDYSWLGNRFIIHGHTPISENAIEHLLLNFENDQFLNIDGGCVYALYGIAGKGNLCAIDLDARKLYLQPYEDAMISA